VDVAALCLTVCIFVCCQLLLLRRVYHSGFFEGPNGHRLQLFLHSYLSLAVWIYFLHFLVS
jgi:hypothetical protein